MTLFIQLLIVAILLVIAWQDHQYLAVSWVLFPALAILFCLYSLMFLTWQQLIVQISVNMSFIAIQLILLTIYFSLREKRLVNIARKHLGVGDILFLVALCFALSPLNFILFYLFGLLATLLRELMLQPLLRFRTTKIPLAGIQSFLLSGLFISQISCNCFSLSSDLFLLTFLYK